MFELEHDHGMNPDRLDSLAPWEFDVQVSLLIENLKRKAEQKKNKR